MSKKSSTKSPTVNIERLPVCPFYHNESELITKSGCYPNINEVQFEAATKVLQEIKAENLNFNIDEEIEFLKVLRFLRARKFNVEEAMKMIRADVKWRSDDNRLELRQLSAYEVLECDLSLVYTYFPTWIQGYDKQNRPVSYRCFGQFEIWNILKLTSMKQLINFHAWESEQCLRLMHEKSKETGLNIETFTVIVDASGWTISQATRDAFTFIKGMASTDGDHYPERLGKLIVINAPSMLSWAWRTIQGFLDDVTKAKIGIYGCNPDEWRPVLFSMVDESQVPIHYGGTLANLAPADALSSMDPPIVPPPSQHKESYIDHIEKKNSQRYDSFKTANEPRTPADSLKIAFNSSSGDINDPDIDSSSRNLSENNPPQKSGGWLNYFNLSSPTPSQDNLNEISEENIQKVEKTEKTDDINESTSSKISSSKFSTYETNGIQDYFPPVFAHMEHTDVNDSNNGNNDAKTNNSDNKNHNINEDLLAESTYARNQKNSMRAPVHTGKWSKDISTQTDGSLNIGEKQVCCAIV